MQLYTPDGLIIEERGYLDAPTLLAQLGLAPTRAAASRPRAKETRASRFTSGGARPEEAANVDVVRALRAAREQHDEAGCAAAIDDDVVWEDFTTPQPATGKTQVVARFDATLDAFPGLSLECDPRGVEDFVVEECTLHAKAERAAHRRRNEASRAMRREVNVHTVELLQLKEGRVVRAWSYGNSVELAKELGIGKAVKLPSPPTL